MSDAVHTTYAQRFNASYGEALKDISTRYSIREQIIPYIKKHPVRAATIALATTSALAIGAQVYGVALTAAYASGLVATWLAYESSTNKNHRHILPVASLSCIFAAAQQGVTAGLSSNPDEYIPGLVMLGHAALTTAAFSVIPETKTRLRQGVTWVGGLAGAALAFKSANNIGSIVDAIPAVTTIANAFIFSIKDAFTARARPLYVFGLNATHALYFLSQPVVSLGALATEALFALGHVSTAKAHDIPAADRETKEPYPLNKRLGLYFKEVIWNGKKSESLGLTEAECGKERMDHAVFKKIGKFVLGS